MDIEDLIPTFEIGERVIWHRRPTEWRCPNCGQWGREGTPIRDIEVIIIQSRTTHRMLTEHCCNVLIPPQEGFVTVVEPGHEDWEIAVPWPLLEKIKEVV